MARFVILTAVNMKHRAFREMTPYGPVQIYRHFGGTAACVLQIQSGMLQRTILQRTNERYNEQFLSIKSGRYSEHKCYNECG